MTSPDAPPRLEEGVWVEVAPGVLVRRTEPVRVSMSAVVGPRGSLVVDALGDPARALGGPHRARGADPCVEPDSDLAGWAAGLAGLLARLGEADLVVPGHGEVVREDFVAALAARIALKVPRDEAPAP